MENVQHLHVGKTTDSTLFDINLVNLWDIFKEDYPKTHLQTLCLNLGINSH